MALFEWRGDRYISYMQSFSTLDLEKRRECWLIARKLITQARTWSSGGFKLSTLRLMGHPYSPRVNAPPLPPYIINMQTGQFYKGWRLRLAPNWAMVEHNEVSHRYWIMSSPTALMIARPIFQKVESYYQEMVAKGYSRMRIRDAQLVKKSNLSNVIYRRYI